MTKKCLMALLLAVVSLGAKAQFEKGTNYLNTSLTGLDMSYSKYTKFRMGLEVKDGYFVEDNWMVYGRLGYNHQSLTGPDLNSFELGAGVRYYFKPTGVFLSGGLLYEHERSGGFRHNNIDIATEAGYCFYVNHYLSIEPAIYYNLCMNHFSDGSKIGLKLGLGFYF